MAMAMAMMLTLIFPQVVHSAPYYVGETMGWSTGVNYTNWAKGMHFYLGDWLFFVYDRNQMNVLELKSKTDYENCITDHPLHSWPTERGRNGVLLNVSKNYYFTSGKGFCNRGMKLAIHVENPPPPPPRKVAPVGSGSTILLISFEGSLLIPALFATAVVWMYFV